MSHRRQNNSVGVRVHDRERELTHNEVQEKADTLHCTESKIIITAEKRGRKIELEKLLLPLLVNGQKER